MSKDMPDSSRIPTDHARSIESAEERTAIRRCIELKIDQSSEENRQAMARILQNREPLPKAWDHAAEQLADIEDRTHGDQSWFIKQFLDRDA